MREGWNDTSLILLFFFRYFGLHLFEWFNSEEVETLIENVLREFTQNQSTHHFGRSNHFAFHIESGEFVGKVPEIVSQLMGVKVIQN